MKAIVIYESLTGNTRRAAELLATALPARQIEVMAVNAITAIDLDSLSLAELVVIGSWTDGLFVVGQRPARLGRLRSMPTMAGKKAIVFCTYALNPGRVLDKMTETIQDLGADVLGGMAIHRRRMASETLELADRIAAAVVVA